jgi:hypothetical protein
MAERVGLPKGYKAYDGKGCPVDGDQFVDLIIRTGEGLAHSGRTRARFHGWEHPNGRLGNIVGWKKAGREDEFDTFIRWPERAKK